MFMLHRAALVSRHSKTLDSSSECIMLHRAAAIATSVDSKPTSVCAATPRLLGE